MKLSERQKVKCNIPYIYIDIKNILLNKLIWFNFKFDLIYYKNIKT